MKRPDQYADGWAVLTCPGSSGCEGSGVFERLERDRDVKDGRGSRRREELAATSVLVGDDNDVFRDEIPKARGFADRDASDGREMELLISVRTFIVRDLGSWLLGRAVDLGGDETPWSGGGTFSSCCIVSRLGIASKVELEVNHALVAEVIDKVIGRRLGSFV